MDKIEELILKKLDSPYPQDSVYTGSGYRTGYRGALHQLLFDLYPDKYAEDD